MKPCATGCWVNNPPIVVLGARIIDGRPSRMLEARLSTALDLWSSTPASALVVSGRNEAEAMAAWLADKNVPPEAIVAELRAESTNENLENTRALFPDAAYLSVVTNNFHVLRTRVWAWHLGIPVRVIAAPTPRRCRLKNYAREIVALPHSIARVAWRKAVRRLHTHRLGGNKAATG
ncbi:YdcF family protein [Corynebacterium mayonis]|uniref:YdcF family protein n=1 Tax=Corynebacterium mayonis TaxID=3062461 RepID=UPI0031407E99